MKIISSTTSYLGSHIYYVTDNSHVVIIDPADQELIEQVVLQESLTVDFAILTHEHCDHSYGCDWVRKYYNVPIYSSAACSLNLKNERRNESRYFEAFAAVQDKLATENMKKIKPFSTEADITFSGETNIPWRGHDFHLRETPGHSEGSSCIVLDNRFLFSGDTLMWGEMTNTRFPGGNKEDFEKVTIPWLKALDQDTLVYPGHLQQFRLRDRLKYPLV